jgi:sialic acid synthase SpsE/phosphoglycolate phosphatase-like HAD superfamily hydrolase
MAITHIFFDLDGTLVDSLPGIAFSATSALSQVFPGRIAPDFLPFIGPPVREVFRVALHEEDPEKLQLLESAFRQSYDGEGFTKTTPYPGVANVLRALREAGVVCYVLTNKPKRATRAILGHLGLETYFADVITPDSRTPSFRSKSEAALDARDRLGLRAGNVLVVGDSSDDALAAQTCGFEFAAVTFGYGTAHRQDDHPVHRRLERFADLFSSPPLSDGLRPTANFHASPADRVDFPIMSTQTIASNIFQELFVLEMANNHWGNLERGLRIITEFSQVVRFNNVRATIKLQFREVDSFIHKEFRERTDVRYIKKTLDTKMSRKDFGTLVQAIRDHGCLTSATPFDEASVELCEEFNLDMIKLASSDINDWFLIERIAQTRKPVSFSTGGSSLKGVDDLVKFFSNRGIPFAVNHCVSIYPSEDSDLDLNQLDFLRNRYSGAVIGFSSHEYTSWDASMLVAYAKGARTFERHIDIDGGGTPVAPYCSRPHQIDAWFRAFKKAQEMCGGSSTERRFVPHKETSYLDGLVRGVYAKRDLPSGYMIQHGSINEDFYLAIPLQKGQLSCREMMNGERLTAEIVRDQPLMIDSIDSPYSRIESLKKEIYKRGL